MTNIFLVTLASRFYGVYVDSCWALAMNSTATFEILHLPHVLVMGFGVRHLPGVLRDVTCLFYSRQILGREVC